jgi:hypothetical protein
MYLALLVGIAVMLASLLLFSIAIALIVNLMARVLQTGYVGQSFLKNVVIMIAVTFIVAAAHYIQIALWAATLLALGEMSSFETAFYFSAENYTALGYGDLVLSDRWRLLGPVEAINGLLLFGLSTAAMFAVLSRLVSSHLHPGQGHPGEARRLDA